MANSAWARRRPARIRLSDKDGFWRRYGAPRRSDLDRRGRSVGAGKGPGRRRASSHRSRRRRHRVDCAAAARCRRGRELGSAAHGHLHPSSSIRARKRYVGPSRVLVLPDDCRRVSSSNGSRAVPLPASQPILAQLLRTLKSHPGVVVRFEGHVNATCGLECRGATGKPCKAARKVGSDVRALPRRRLRPVEGARRGDQKSSSRSAASTSTASTPWASRARGA